MRFVVVAGTYQQAVDWRQRNGVPPSEMIYATPHSVLGLRANKNTRLIVTGTPWERPEFDEIRDCLIIAGFDRESL